MQKARGGFASQVCRGQRGGWRPPETAETRVGRLITSDDWQRLARRAT